MARAPVISSRKRLGSAVSGGVDCCATAIAGRARAQARRAAGSRMVGGVRGCGLAEANVAPDVRSRAVMRMRSTRFRPTTRSASMDMGAKDTPGGKLPRGVVWTAPRVAHRRRPIPAARRRSSATPYRVTRGGSEALAVGPRTSVDHPRHPMPRDERAGDGVGPHAEDDEAVVRHGAERVDDDGPGTLTIEPGAVGECRARGSWWPAALVRSAARPAARTRWRGRVRQGSRTTRHARCGANA